MTTTTNTAEMNQKQLRAACREAGISGYGSLTVAAMREALASARTGVEMVAVVTTPKAKKIAPRTATVARGSRIDRVYNNDGSITAYARGVKVHRTLSDQQIEDGEAPENYDAEEDMERFLRRWFGAGPRVMGRVAHGHFWKRKVAAPKTDEAQA